MIIKHKHIRFIRKWLDRPMHGDELKARNAFIKAITPQYEEIEKTRVATLEKHADKGEDGKPIVDAGQYKLSEEGQKATLEEYNTFLEGSKSYPDLDKTVAHQIARSIETNPKGYGLDEGMMIEEVIKSILE